MRIRINRSERKDVRRIIDAGSSFDPISKEESKVSMYEPYTYYVCDTETGKCSKIKRVFQGAESIRTEFHTDARLLKEIQQKQAEKSLRSR